MSSKTKNDAKVDVPGNVLETARRHEEYLAKVGYGWLQCREALAQLEEVDITVKKVVLKGFWSEGEEMLVVLSALGPEGDIVAFHNVAVLENMWRGLLNRIRSGNLKWREDTPYERK